MNERMNSAGESGSFSPWAIVVTAIAICAVTGAAAALAPSKAAPQVSTSAPYAGPSGYFPDQFVNQAKEIEPMPDTF